MSYVNSEMTIDKRTINTALLQYEAVKSVILKLTKQRCLLMIKPRRDST
jgi:hypothetical protein